MIRQCCILSLAIIAITNAFDQLNWTTTDFFSNESDSHESSDSHEDPYSLYGILTIPNPSDDTQLFAVTIEVNNDCSQINFIFITPANDGWFSIGIGGDYDLAESSEDMPHSHEGVSEAVIMNGYAIVVLGVDDIYESTLGAGMAPVRHGTNNLVCDGTQFNGIQRIECNRLYDTENEDDFYQFINGENRVIYAYGLVGNDGSPLQHGMNGYGDAHKHFIYMQKGDALCGYAEQYQNAQMKEETEEEKWIIVAVVFIVLFIVMLLLVVYLLWKYRCNGASPKTGTKQGYVQTSQLEKINTDTIDEE